LAARFAWFEWYRRHVLGTPRLLVPLVAVTLFTSGRARADDERDVAAQFFAAAEAAAKRGEFRVCAEAFTEAHKRAPHSSTIYNAGLCWESAGNLPRAANDYKEALAKGQLTDAQASQAKKRATDLETKLGEIEVTGPVGGRGSVGPMEDRPIPFSTFVTPGDYLVKVEADGKTVSQRVHVDAGESTPIELDVDDDTPAQPPPVERPVTPAKSSPGIQPILGWSLVGAGVVAGGFALGFYMSARSARDEFDADRTDSSKRDTAESRLNVSRITGGAAILLAGTGITLILTAPKQPTATGRVRVRVHPNGASAQVTFW
jgi:hypothetical protein